MASRIEGDRHYAGQVSFAAVTLPNGAITDSKVAAAADIAATKLEHRHSFGYAQESATASADETRVVEWRVAHPV